MFGTTPLIMIEDDAALIAAAERLSAAPVIGVDTEADSFHSYREKVCLVQLSDLENDYIVDPLKVTVFLQAPVKAGCAAARGKHAAQPQ